MDDPWFGTESVQIEFGGGPLRDNEAYLRVRRGVARLIPPGRQPDLIIGLLGQALSEMLRLVAGVMRLRRSFDGAPRGERRYDSAA
jgi:hypothetical protein